MSSRMGSLSSIADGFVAAALDPSRWDSAMDGAARATGSFGAILAPFRGRSPIYPMSDGLQPVTEAYVRNGWIHRDVRYKPLQAYQRRGVVTEYDFTTDEEIACDPYYQNFLSPHKLRWFAGVVVGKGPCSSKFLDDAGRPLPITMPDRRAAAQPGVDQKMTR
jgi:hypothetical protein